MIAADRPDQFLWEENRWVVRFCLHWKLSLVNRRDVASKILGGKSYHTTKVNYLLIPPISKYFFKHSGMGGRDSLAKILSNTRPTISPEADNSNKVLTNNAQRVRNFKRAVGIYPSYSFRKRADKSPLADNLYESLSSIVI